MYFFNITYDVENRLNYLRESGFDKILHSDWLGLITITNEKRVIVNSVNDYKYLGSTNIIKLLTLEEIDLINFNKGTFFTVTENNVDYNLILGVVCEWEGNKTVLVSCSFDKKYDEKELIIFNLLKKISYENVVLSNQMIKEKNYLQNIFDSTELGFISINLQGEIIKVNKIIYDELGVQSQDIIGKSFYGYLTSFQRKKMEKDIEYITFNNKRVTYKDIIFENKLGEKMILNMTISPLIDGQNHVYGVVIVITDITKTIILEKELEQVKKISLLGDVSSNIAHEIRNPLMGIRGCARILQKGIDKNNQQYEFMESIISEVDSANSVIERFLSYSRMNRNDTFTLIDLNEALEKCSNLIFFYKENKQIVVKKYLCENSPRIKANIVKLQQAFLNIFINSVQAIEDEGTITIKTSYDEIKKEIVAEISDTGCGIENDKIKGIFDPYITTKRDGTGLGLSITKKIIENNGGKIFVNSKKNLGTDFKIVFQYKEMV